MIRVEIDREACLGVGQCSAIAPEVFNLGDDGKSEPVTGWAADAGAAAEARDLCPALAISLHRSPDQPSHEQ
ncbi:ferredoxin [Streptacidiphilus albus]|uniref:ferredoxin n=1 Tax=Streptacidiphilus albus TaxID=105425 RepID=UPI00068B88DD|nr:ferredoxin [Streptacidiphilus albus]